MSGRNTHKTYVFHMEMNCVIHLERIPSHLSPLHFSIDSLYHSQMFRHYARQLTDSLLYAASMRHHHHHQVRDVMSRVSFSSVTRQPYQTQRHEAPCTKQLPAPHLMVITEHHDSQHLTNHRHHCDIRDLFHVLYFSGLGCFCFSFVKRRRKKKKRVPCKKVRLHMEDCWCSSTR